MCRPLAVRTKAARPRRWVTPARSTARSAALSSIPYARPRSCRRSLHATTLNGPTPSTSWPASRSTAWRSSIHVPYGLPHAASSPINNVARPAAVQAKARALPAGPSPITTTSTDSSPVIADPGIADPAIADLAPFASCVCGPTGFEFSHPTELLNHIRGCVIRVE